MLSTSLCPLLAVGLLAVQACMPAALSPQRMHTVSSMRKDQCRGNHTLCKSTHTGNYGCCPHVNATCCDEQHCCPHGYTCGLTVCHPEQKTIPTLKVPQWESVPCPDNATQCRDNYTCCMLESHYWGCCPFPSATCCSDGQHCCPMGYTCKLPYCIKGFERIAMINTLQSTRKL